MLTGKMIHEAWASLDPPSLAWGSVQQKTRDIYNAVAERLNAQLDKAGEEANEVQYTPEQVKAILEMGVLWNLQKTVKWQGEPFAPRFAANSLYIAFEAVAHILPDDIRPLVRQILSLYEQATTQEE